MKTFCSNQIKFTISGTHLKITMYAKKKENTTHNGEKTHSIQTDTELTLMLESTD